MSYLICGIHDRRPDVCRRYPQPGSYLPQSCGFRFAAGERKGHCYLECQASCCRLPRQGGEPGGAPLPEIAGGLPCKHLVSCETAPAGAEVKIDTEAIS